MYKKSIEKGTQSIIGLKQPPLKIKSTVKDTLLSELDSGRTPAAKATNKLISRIASTGLNKHVFPDYERYLASFFGFFKSNPAQYIDSETLEKLRAAGTLTFAEEFAKFNYFSGLLLNKNLSQLDSSFSSTFRALDSPLYNVLRTQPQPPTIGHPIFFDRVYFDPYSTHCYSSTSNYPGLEKTYPTSHLVSIPLPRRALNSAARAASIIADSCVLDEETLRLSTNDKLISLFDKTLYDTHTYQRYVLLYSAAYNVNLREAQTLISESVNSGQFSYTALEGLICSSGGSSGLTDIDSLRRAYLLEALEDPQFFYEFYQTVRPYLAAISLTDAGLGVNLADLVIENTGQDLMDYLNNASPSFSHKDNLDAFFALNDHIITTI